MSDPVLAAACPLPRTPWPAARAARLGFLVGLGLDARGIAADAAIASSPARVHAQVRRFGLAFRTARARLPPPVMHRLEAAARRRGLSRDGLIQKLLLNAGSDDALLDNILDDLD